MSLSKLHSLSILIPTYNDEQTIEDVVIKAKDMARNVAHKFEIIVLNDGSTNTVPLLLKHLQDKVPELRILTHTHNQGYGAAIKDLYYAGKYQWIVTLPGDGQIDPSEVKKLLIGTTKADMILGKREIRNDHIKRRLQSKTYNLLLKIFFHIPTTDVNTIRLMKKEIMDNITLTSSSPFVDAELVLKSVANHYRLLEVSIVHKARITPGATGGRMLTSILPTIVELFRYWLVQR